MLAAAGHRSIAAGNVGISILDAVTEPEPYPVVAVELSSFQLYWSSSVTPLAAVVLNIAAHHLDWHDDIESYAAAKGRIFAPGTIAICNADDPRAAAMARAATQVSRAVAFRLGRPRAGELGVADGWLSTGLRRVRRAALPLAASPDVRPAGAAQRGRCAGRRRAGPGLRRPAGRGRGRARPRSSPSRTG